MTRSFQDVIDEAKELDLQYAGCAAMWDDMEAMYFIKPKVKPKAGEHSKVTISPDPHNKIMGAIRLMVATDPEPIVTKTDEISQETCDQIEAFCKAMWAASGNTSGTPPHYDLITAGLMYGTATIGVVSMRKLAQMAEGKATEKLAKQVEAQTPYLFESWNPRTCRARLGRLGMTAHLRKVETTAGVIIDDWGKEGEEAVGPGSRARPKTLNEWWDLEYHTAWVEGSSKPILHALHEMSFIPIATTLTEGSQALFSKPVQQLMPFLYAVAKSGLWDRANLGLTWLYTLIFALGSSPMFKYKRNREGKVVDIDFDRPAGIVNLDVGEEFESLIKLIVDPSLMQGLSIADTKITESTMYPQALGQALTGNQPYSTVALLSQSGRLPLVSPQKRLGWLIARAMWMACMWTKESGEGGKRKASAGLYSSFDTSNIPDTLDLQAHLEIALPQDKLSMANVAGELKKLGILSDQWIRQNTVGVSRDKQMRRQIMKEQYFNMMAQKFGEAMLNPPAPATQTAQPTPEELARLEAAAQGQSGSLPSGVGIPPEQLAGGMQGPEPIPGQEVL